MRCARAAACGAAAGLRGGLRRRCGVHPVLTAPTVCGCPARRGPPRAPRLAQPRCGTPDIPLRPLLRGAPCPPQQATTAAPPAAPGPLQRRRARSATADRCIQPPPARTPARPGFWRAAPPARVARASPASARTARRPAAAAPWRTSRTGRRAPRR